MITLYTESLRAFQKKSQQIATNTLLPILSNLKLEFDGNVCTITKNALNSIVIGQVAATGEPGLFLINERVLFSAILANTSKESISLHVEGNQLIITDEDKTYLPLESPFDFPNPPPYNRDSETLKLTNQHLTAIGIAGKYINDVETAGHMQCVHMSGENIFAFHPNYFYINGGFSNLPAASFRSQETKIIGELENVEFLDLPNHHIFFTPGYEYVFTKTESAMPALEGVFASLRLQGADISFSAGDLINFCQRANSVSESEIATCSLAPDGVFVKLKLNDVNYSRSNERFITCVGVPEEFTFNSRLILEPLKAIPHKQLKGKTLRNYLIVNEGDEWFCFAGMAKAQGK
jgi:DNA polymerase III sliding clamp (beta) subunit (PCNA family)